MITHQFTEWKYAVEKCISYSKTNYHEFCVVAAGNFSKAVNGKTSEASKLAKL